MVAPKSRAESPVLAVLAVLVLLAVRAVAGTRKEARARARRAAEAQARTAAVALKVAVVAPMVVAVLQAINKVGQEGEVFVFGCPLVRLRRSSPKESLGGKDRFSEWFL